MADIDVLARIYKEGYISSFSVSPTSVQLERGDTVTFYFESTGTEVATGSFSNFLSDVFTDSSMLYLSHGQSAVKYVSGSASLKTFNITATSDGNYKYISTEIVSSVDSTPDSFSLGSNISAANPGETLHASAIAVSGINTSVTASVTGTAQISINAENTWGASKTVSNGDTVYLRMTSSSSYGSTVGTTLDIGGVTDYWSITTKNDPGSGEIIMFPVTTVPIKLSEVINFFGGTSSQRNIRSYFKAGGLVPNITENSSIPTSGTIRLTDFLGSATSLYLSKDPKAQNVSANTLNSAQTLDVSWIINGSRSHDPAAGFGSVVEAAEFRWVLNDPSNQATIENTTTGDAAVGTWSSSHKGVRVYASSSMNSEKIVDGDVTGYIRSSYDTTKVISFNVNFRMYFYGP